MEGSSLVKRQVGRERALGSGKGAGAGTDIATDNLRRGIAMTRGIELSIGSIASIASISFELTGSMGTLCGVVLVVLLVMV